MGGTKSDPFIYSLAAGICQTLRGGVFTGTLSEYVLLPSVVHMGPGTHGKRVRDVHEHLRFPEAEAARQKDTYKSHTGRKIWISVLSGTLPAEKAFFCRAFYMCSTFVDIFPVYMGY